jgi:hypothetical protein
MISHSEEIPTWRRRVVDIQCTVYGIGHGCEGTAGEIVVGCGIEVVLWWCRRLALPLQPALGVRVRVHFCDVNYP